MREFRSILVAVVLGTALVVGAFLLNRQRPLAERGQPTPALVKATGKCAECHRRETSAIVSEEQTGYVFVKRESQDAVGWVSLSGRSSPTTTANR